VNFLSCKEFHIKNPAIDFSFGTDKTFDGQSYVRIITLKKFSVFRVVVRRLNFGPSARIGP
jgi:hypothetical protein